MKRQAGEATPLWVWLAFALMGAGMAAYLAGYLMVDEVVSFLK